MKGFRVLVFRAILPAFLIIIAATGAHAAAPKDEISVDLATEIDKVARIPERFAVEVPHRIGVQAQGTWSDTGNVRTWNYQVQVPGAVSLSFHADRATLPSGVTLSVSGGGAEYRYTSKDVHRGELWSRITRGDTLTFALSADAAQAGAVILDVVGLQAGFRSLGKGGPNNPHYDVLRQGVKASAATTVCVENYECHITPANRGPGQASVTLVIANLGLCSGVLLNDVPGDGTPYVLTARHCENGNPDGGDPSAASGVTAYFDAVTPCGQTLGSVYDTATSAITGAVTMVEQQDAWLIRLDGPLPVTDAYFAGWDASGAGYVGGYTAHYGLGSARQYAGWYGQAYYAQMSAARVGVHYTSTFWDLVNQVGSIAPGASGSGVFDTNDRFVGTIVRGESQTTAADSPGVCPALAPPAPSPTTATAFATALSGIFDSTADPESTTGAVTLRTVLDPQGSGTLTLNGKWMPPQLSASSSTSGTGSLVTLTWSAPGATSCTASGGHSGDGWSGTLAGSGSQTVTEYTSGAVTYVLTCNSVSTQSSASVTVTWSLATPAATIQVSSGSNGFVSFPIQLTWTSTVSPCTATGGIAGDGWGGTIGGRGTLTVIESTAGTYTYVLSCGSGSRTATAQVKVTFVAPTATLQDGGITSVNIGLPVTLSGMGTGTSCATSGGGSGDGWAGLNFLALGEVYSVTETTPGTYTYTFTCSAGSITASSSVTVTFTNGPPAVTLTTSPAVPTVGNSFLHVSWVASVAPCSLTVAGYAGYTLSNYSYIGYHDDSQNVIGTYTYTVTCGTGSATASASKTVTWGGTPQLILNAGSSPLVLGSPESVFWSGNVTPCTASGGQSGDGWTGTSTTAVGFLAVTEAQPGTYTYSLTCGTGTQTAQAQATLTISAGPVFATLTASAPNAPEGGTPVILTWNSNTSPCQQIGDYGNGGWHNSIASSGTASISENLPGAHTYILQCGSGGPATLATAQVVVTFTGPPQPTFTSLTGFATAGQPFTLGWASADGSACNATLGVTGDGWAGPRPASGTAQVTELITGPYAYAIKCGIAAESLLGIEVYPAPIPSQPPTPTTAQITLSAAQIFPDQSASLSWTANGAASCVASGGSGTDGWQGSIPATGSQSVMESAPGSYTFDISCSGTGTVTGQAVLVVKPAPTVILSTSATTVDTGQPFTLTWSSTETSGCTANGGSSGDGWSGSESTSGNASVTETTIGSYSYTVSCTAGSETVQALADVVVIASATGGSGHSGGGGTLDIISLAALSLLFFVRRRSLRLRRSARVFRKLVGRVGIEPTTN